MQQIKTVDKDDERWPLGDGVETADPLGATGGPIDGVWYGQEDPEKKGVVCGKSTAEHVEGHGALGHVMTGCV